MSKNENLKVALVTGSSRGIGAGIAKYLMEKGFFVYVTYCNNKSAAEAICQDSSRCKVIYLDLTNEDSIKEAFSAVKKDLGRLDLLVNNANVEIPGNTEKITSEIWEKLFSIKVTGTFLATKYAIPLMKRLKRSTIVNITSSLCHHGQPEYPPHTAAEAAVISYTKTCAIDLARYGIRCHCVNPGVTRTEMWKDIGGYEDDEMWKGFAKNNPLGRVCTPEDVAKAIYLLTTDEAEFMNGNEIYVNGGSHLK